MPSPVFDSFRRNSQPANKPSLQDLLSNPDMFRSELEKFKMNHQNINPEEVAKMTIASGTIPQQKVNMVMSLANIFRGMLPK